MKKSGYFFNSPLLIISISFVLFFTCLLSKTQQPPLFPSYYNAVISPGTYLMAQIPTQNYLTFDVQCFPLSGTEPIPCSIYLFISLAAFDQFVNGSRSSSLWLTPPSVLNSTQQVIQQNYPCQFDVVTGGTGIFAIVSEKNNAGSVNVRYNYAISPIVVKLPNSTSPDFIWSPLIILTVSIVFVVVVVSFIFFVMMALHNRRRKDNGATGYLPIQTSDPMYERV